MTRAATHLLFDFFGTLVEYSASRTEQGYGRSYALLRSAGAPLGYDEFLSQWSRISEEFDAAAERSRREFSMLELVDAFLGRVSPVHDDALVRNFADTYVSEWNRGVRYLPGVRELLARLHGRFTLAVITNTHDSTLVPRHLERMDVSGYFQHVVTSVEFGARKPAPEIFQHALGLLGAAAEDCVYVGDNYEADYRGAMAAGIRPLLIDPAETAPVGPETRLGSVLEVERHVTFGG
ncbi:MAG: HAD family hydrolase [Proteobacteria bacterium]|nr:HAD family hydrolase [Pseudomonadota bacterium]